MFTWATAESTVWPIIPDFLLLPVTVAQRRRPHIPLVATILGSALGGAAWHAWASHSPDAALHAVRRIPLVRSDQIRAVQTRIARSGPNALLTQPWSGIGLKVWAPVAATNGIPAGRALLAFTAARSLRMGLVTALTVVVARAVGRRLEVLALPVGIIYVALFVPLWWRVASRHHANGDS
jgi:membrane protein YqaA with SNARE-associated domain